MLDSRTKVATYGPCTYSSSDSVVGPSEKVTLVFMTRYARTRFFRLFRIHLRSVPSDFDQNIFPIVTE